MSPYWEELICPQRLHQFNYTANQFSPIVPIPCVDTAAAFPSECSSKLPGEVFVAKGRKGSLNPSSCCNVTHPGRWGG